MFTSTAADSLREDDWDQKEHIVENTFVFPGICSGPGSTGTSSAGTTNAHDTVDSSRIATHLADHGASFEGSDEFGVFERNAKMYKSKEEQEYEDLKAVVLVSPLTMASKLYGVPTTCLSSCRVTALHLHALTTKATSR